MSVVLILLVTIGSILGWLASIVTRSESHRDILHNIAIGIGGALAAGVLINPLVRGGNILNGNFDVTALAVSILGAVLLLAMTNLIRRNVLQ